MPNDRSEPASLPRPSADRGGFRLRRFEVFNWGTFHNRVWSLTADGDNALLTGDIGSGKSTLVDALTTLLAPPARITFNKAAGAEARERTLYSYVRGEFRSLKNEYGEGRKAEALRSENSYTVLLAEFHHAALDVSVTLAQVLWIKDGERSPARLHLMADRALGIAEHFSDFGTDLLALRKKLRSTAGVKLHDSFSDYAAHFRRALGIHHEQALDLFYQTVSMKSVGNLTDFVRAHMLDRTDMQPRLDQLRRDFDNLTQAHAAVLKARAQIEALTPLVADGDRHDALLAESAQVRRLRDALAGYFAGHRLALLDIRIAAQRTDEDKRTRALRQKDVERAALNEQKAELSKAIEISGGGRLRELDAGIRRAEIERERRRSKESDYRRLTTALGLRGVASIDEFVDCRDAAAGLVSASEEEHRRLNNELIDSGIEFKRIGERAQQLGDEIASLKQRESNIPDTNIRIRRSMAEVLDIVESELPFAGELLQVAEDEVRWEGAIERLLHGFALSLLVPPGLYGAVSDYVDRTQLGGRLVYLHARDERARNTRTAPDAQSVARKLRVKPDSGLYSWLTRELTERYDHRCCASLDEFRRLPRAITVHGQIKSNERQHEKDDRHLLNDRSRFVLGWDSTEKRKALEATRLQLLREQHEIAKKREQSSKSRERQSDRLLQLKLLLAERDFAELDWWSKAQEIEALQIEKHEIEQSSDRLKLLQDQMRALVGTIAQADSDFIEASNALAVLRSEIAANEAERVETAPLCLPELGAAEIAPELDGWRERTQPGRRLELRTLNTLQSELRESLQNEIDRIERSAKRAAEALIKQMQDYKRGYPAETSELDANTEALGEFRKRLRVLQDEDLPSHEKRFKQMLNENTINGMAAFRAHLEASASEIRKKIEVINRSLTGIDYDDGTFIELLSEPTPDREVRDFQLDLKACLAHATDDRQLYTEDKFLQVKAVIDRFNGREGTSEIDARWSAKVTDVRNWFGFSASEKWRIDKVEKEFYSDSAGKSGGQKEKLAYTILASALAYQFGLDATKPQAKNFRFVVIDEAFGRGSDDSTRYGLELFKSLDLQLLIVTPLQKIHVIEDYIATVHYVHNRDGRESVVRTLGIEEYRAEKAAHRLLLAAR